MKQAGLASILLLATAACAQQPAPPPQPDRLLGRWIGVEGMTLVIAAGTVPGRYTLDMQWDLDHRGTFAGTGDGKSIVFERGGVRETLRPSDGNATGLKYLAGKTDCLTVKIGEGYCRA